jgi:hypothetical protein
VRASLARAISLPELVAASSFVIAGTPLEALGHWENSGGRKRIVTDTRVRIDEVLGGSPSGSEISIRTLGGRVGKIGQTVHGEAFLRIAERAFLFVTPATDGVLAVTGMAQGHYPLRADSAGVARVHASPLMSELRAPSQSAVVELVGKSFDEARDRIRKVWRDAR